MKYQVFQVFRAGENPTTGEPKFGRFAATGAHEAEVVVVLVAYFNAMDPENTYEAGPVEDVPVKWEYVQERPE